MAVGASLAGAVIAKLVPNVEGNVVHGCELPELLHKVMCLNGVLSVPRGRFRGQGAPQLARRDVTNTAWRTYLLLSSSSAMKAATSARATENDLCCSSEEATYPLRGPLVSFGGRTIVQLSAVPFTISSTRRCSANVAENKRAQ